MAQGIRDFTGAVAPPAARGRIAAVHGPVTPSTGSETVTAARA
jgi:hypothetical protein